MKLRDVGFTIGFASMDDGPEHPAIRDEKSGTITFIDKNVTRGQLIDILTRVPDYWLNAIYGEQRADIRPATVYGEHSRQAGKK